MTRTGPGSGRTLGPAWLAACGVLALPRDKKRESFQQRQNGTTINQQQIGDERARRRERFILKTIPRLYLQKWFA